MLRRVLGVPLLVGYGVGVIVGAGIYVLVGPVVSAAGAFAPVSFLLAGVVAAMTAMCYAELAARFPEAAGAAAYVKEAFGSDLLSRVIGVAVAAVTLTSTAAVARGSVGYVQYFFDLAPASIMAAIILSATTVACIGVRDSVLIATAMTVVEVAGLVLVVVAGWARVPPVADALAMAPQALSDFKPVAVATGAFLSFFAYIGFENLANMAEEAHESEKSLPQALLLSVGVSTVLYILVAIVAVASLSADPSADRLTPLLHVGAGAGWHSPPLIAAIALIAVSNGILIEILMLSRLLYGMAHRGWLPGWLAKVNPATAGPVRATIVSGVAVLALTLSFDTTFLAGLTSTMTLLVFAFVTGGLWRLQRLHPRARGFTVPHLLPPLAAAMCLGLATVQLLR